MFKKSTIKSLLATLLLATPAAQAVTLDFEGFGNGTIMDNEYLVSHGVSISAQNLSTGPNYAVIFDTTPSGSSPNFSSDPDLIGNFDNIAPDAHNQSLPDDYDPGNVLIIQENLSGCSGNTCVRPDDEGSRPAGIFTFNFRNAIELLSIDFFDVERAENGTGPANRIDVWDFDTNVLTTVGHTPNTGGDNLWAQLLFDSNNPALRNIGRIDIHMGGSGAIDNLTYNVVPVPAAVWLFGTALIGFIGYSRRRTI